LSEINEYIKLISSSKPNNLIINWTWLSFNNPEKEALEFIEKMDFYGSLETISHETNEEINDFQHFMSRTWGLHYTAKCSIRYSTLVRKARSGYSEENNIFMGRSLKRVEQEYYKSYTATTTTTTSTWSSTTT
jgi:hypothetical protein